MARRESPENFMNKSPFLWLLGALCAGLTACSSMAPRPVAEATVPVKPAPTLPNVALTPDVLYDLLLGEIAGQRGQLGVAVTELTRAAIKTRDPRLAERATLVSLYAHHPKEAEQDGRLWVELEPDSIEAHEALATVMMDTGKMREAQAQLENILALSSSDHLAQTYLRIAAVMGRVRDHAAALRVMQVLAQLHPQLPEAQFAVAHLAVRSGDLDTANQAIDRALKSRPGWEEAALFKMRVLASQKDSQKVLAFSEKFLDAYPHAINFRMNYARYLVDLKQWDKALEQFKRVATESPNDPDAVYAVGLLALQTNDLDVAQKYLERNLKLQPDNDQARIYLGQIAEQRKHYDDAARWYREVPAGNSYFEAQARLSMVMAEQGDLSGARAQLHQLHPESEQQEVQLSLTEEQMLRHAKQYNEAYKVLTAALVKLPNNTDLLYARALIEDKLNRIDLHEADLRKILKQDPKNATALNALGYTLADRTTRYQEALSLVQQALTLRPGDPYIMDSMGWVQYRLGHNAEAVKYLRAALEKRPDAEISAHLGEVLWVMGEKTEAKSVWNRALKTTPDNEVLLGVIKKFKP